MRFVVISCYCLALNIFLVSPITLGGIKDKEVPRCIQNLGKNVMESYIISSKTSYFFIQGRLKIMGYCCDFVINKGARFSI